MRSRTVREGSVGLLAIVGIVIFGGLVLWIRSFNFGQDSYEITVKFPDVNGIQPGAPVNYRGVRVGQITRIAPNPNGVDVTLEISSADIKIPQDVEIQANRSGLVGESSVDITPLAPSPNAVNLESPISADCNTDLIVCEDEQLQGETGPQLVPTLARLSQLYGTQEFYDNVNSAAKNTAVAATQIAGLSQDISLLTNTAQKGLKNFTGAADSISGAAGSIASTATETAQLVNDVNSLLEENRSSLTQAVDSLNETSQELNQLIGNTNQDLDRLVASLETTVGQLNTKLESVDTVGLIQNLETLTANAAEASANLRTLSAALNQPANLVTLQQTLDSARATFANAQKITADLDELTGDPAFRSNVRELVNGLSSLVSSTEQLQQQVETAQTLSSELEALPLLVELQELQLFVSSSTADSNIKPLSLLNAAAGGSSGGTLSNAPVAQKAAVPDTISVPSLKKTAKPLLSSP